jgi:hypothetical protein
MTRTNGPEQERVEKFQEVSISCDLCGAIASGRNNGCEEVDWGSETYEVAVSSVYFRAGNDIPMVGGEGDRATADICPDCFKAKLIPWLNSQGANVHVKEYGY